VIVVLLKLRNFSAI